MPTRFSQTPSQSPADSEYGERFAALQIRLSRLARLNAMGEMAGTLAHELNQPLTAISSYADAAQWSLTAENADLAQISEMLKKILAQTQRARAIIDRIRLRVEGGGIILAPEPLSEIIVEAVDASLAGAVKDGITLRFEFDPEADAVLVDRIEIQQVVINLVRNAADAMAGHDRREVVIGFRPASEEEVQCWVEDTGAGVSPAMAETLFEPFASDKKQGMGIGLAVSRNIVEAHGGRIWAEPGRHGGAAFNFTLKRAAPGVSAK